MKATLNAKVISSKENSSKNEQYKRDFPFIVDMLIPEVIDGEKVFVPHTRIPSKLKLEKGEQSLEVEFSGSAKSYELRVVILDIAKTLKK